MSGQRIIDGLKEAVAMAKNTPTTPGYYWARFRHEPRIMVVHLCKDDDYDDLWIEVHGTEDGFSVEDFDWISGASLEEPK